MNRILIIGAHYDDAELGAGGVAARFVEEGKSVYKLTLTDNSTNFKQRNVEVEYLKSKNESSEACKILGVKEIDFQPERCSYLTYSTELMQRIEKVIWDYDIDTVFAHFSTDMNQDHIAAYKLSTTAARHCDNILLYQSNGYIIDNAFYPTVFFNISKYIDKKKSALSMYDNSHNRMNRLFDICIERNSVWGYANEVNYAEGFHPIKIIL